MKTTTTKTASAPATSSVVRRWLVAEYCGHDLFTGWHLYLRDDPGYQKPNNDGGWGWIRHGSIRRDYIVAFFATLGIELKGDWSCPEYGCAEFVKRYPLKGCKVWGERRGGVQVIEDYWGDLTLHPPNNEVCSQNGSGSASAKGSAAPPER